MADTLERPIPPPSQLELELERMGLVRRLFKARQWYGADWWFVAISSVLVLFFLILAAFPGLFAPYDPRAQVGPRLLGPGETPEVEAIAVLEGSGYAGLSDLAGDDRAKVAVVQGTPSSQAVRDRADALNTEAEAAGVDLGLRLRIVRFDTLEEALTSMVEGETVAVAASSIGFDSLAEAFPSVTVLGPIEGGVAAGGGFTLGTNQLGQDVLSRLIWGTRIAFVIGFAAALFSLTIGLPLGLIAGYRGGKLDRGLSLVMDSMYAFPGLILAIAITAVLGPSILNVVVAIGVVYVPTYFRIVRGQALSVKEELYVEAARSLGAKSRDILRRYIFPNVIPSVAIIFSVNVADAILTGAGLSFLGLGLPPDVPDWGIDLARGQEQIQHAWWMITFPGLMVMSTVFAFTMMGEGLMEIFNPKLRDR